MEAPGAGRYASAIHCDATRASVLGPTLLWDAVVQMRESREQRRLAAPGRMQALQCDSVPRAGVRGVLQQGAWGRPRRVCEDRLPPRLLVLQPAPPPRARGWPCRGGAVGSPGAQPLPQGHDAHALALAYPVKQGVAL